MEFLKKWEVPAIIALWIVMSLVLDFGVFVGFTLVVLFIDWLLGWPFMRKIDAWLNSHGL